MYRLNIDLVRIYEIDNSGLANPLLFSASSGHPEIIDLAWNQNENGDPVMIAFNTTNTFGTPQTGTSYDPLSNSSIPGGGTVIYNGAATAFQHTGRTGGTQYFYKAWSVRKTPTPREYLPLPQPR